MCPYELMTRKKEKMSMELFKRIIDDAVTSGIKVITLNFYNEPLCDDLLFDRIRYARSKGMVVGFFSNGTINKNLEILESGLDFIIFSFDGATKDTYEKIRRGANFERTKENIIDLIRERNKRGLSKPHVTISMRIQNENFSEVKDFKAWGKLADNIHIGPSEDRRRERVGEKRLGCNVYFLVGNCLVSPNYML
jgi:MoaA/NifB/PqqE/SkfB family radical SAM enzyme